VKGKSEVIPQICVIASAIIAFFLGISLLSGLASPRALNLAIVFGFLVTVIICFSLGSRMALRGETTHKILLLVSLLLGSVPIFLLSFFSALVLEMSSPGWREYNPSAVYNMSVTTVGLFVLASILAVGAISVLISIVRTRGK
jgi:hypothetical protein